MRNSAPPLLGSTKPRLYTPPLVTGRPGPCGCGCALTPATSLGFSAVEFAEQVVGMQVLPWQRWLLIHAMELRPDGRFRFRTVLILVSRQNGKTTIIEVKNLFKMFVLRVPLVIGTAQNLDISEESWDKAVEIAEGIPELADEVAHVDKTNGKKALKLTNGSRWKIAAASRKGGRGLAGDDVNLDELREHQNWESWAAVTKTTMARANAQVYAFSNAGDDKSVVLNELQEKGRALAEQLVEFLAKLVVAEAESIAHLAAEQGIDTSLGLFEWSAPDDVRCTCGRPEGVHLSDCRLQDRRAWAQANPSLGYTITEEAIASALATDPEPIFRTECLCQRVPNLAGEWQVITAEQWGAGEDGASQLVGRPAVVVDVTPDRAWASIAVVGARADGGRHVEITSNEHTGIDHRPGTAWVVPRLLELEAHLPLVLIINDKALADAAEAAGLVVYRPTAADMVTGCQLTYDGLAGADVAGRNVHHLGQQELTDAAAGATKRVVGGSWAWDRRDWTVDISPLVAVSLGLFGLATPRVHRPSRVPMAAYA